MKIKILFSAYNRAFFNLYNSRLAHRYAAAFAMLYDALIFFGANTPFAARVGDGFLRELYERFPDTIRDTGDKWIVVKSNAEMHVYKTSAPRA